MSHDITLADRIRRELLTSYRKPLFRPFVHAVKSFSMLSPGEHIAVCLAPSVSSLLLAVLLSLLHAHSDFPFELSVFCPSSPENALTNELAESLGLSPVPLTDADAIPDLSSWKMAVPQHFEENVHTILYSMLMEGRLRALPPKEKLASSEIIRPLFFLRDADIRAWADSTGIFPPDMPLDMFHPNDTIASLLAHLQTVSPDTEKNIFASVQNLDLDTFPEWHAQNPFPPSSIQFSMKQSEVPDEE